MTWYQDCANAIKEWSLLIILMFWDCLNKKKILFNLVLLEQI